MVDGTTQMLNEEPGAGPQDSKASNGVQPGGITPQVAKALEGLSPEARAVVEEDIAKRNRWVTAERQRLSSDVQLAGILRDFLKDPEFNRYVEARESDALETFYLDELKSRGKLPSREDSQDNQTDAGISALLEDADDPTGTPNLKLVEELKREVSELKAARQREVAERQQSQQEKMVQEFVQNHPDWEDYQPAMQQIAAKYGNALDLEATYHLAKLEVDRNLASSGSEDTSQQQAAASTNAETSDTSQPQNDSARDASRTTFKTGKGKSFTQSFTEAFEQAKKAAGIQGEASFVQ